MVASRLLASLAIVALALALPAATTAAPANGYPPGGKPLDNKCKGYIGDPDCYHFVRRYKSFKRCQRRAKAITGRSEAASGITEHGCVAQPPSGHYVLYVYDAKCKPDVAYRRCPDLS